jgi:hypothetical protein
MMSYLATVEFTLVYIAPISNSMGENGLYVEVYSPATVMLSTLSVPTLIDASMSASFPT